MSDKKIKVAIIGIGNQGEWGIEQYMKSPYVSEIVGADSDPKRADSISKKLGITVYDNAENIWERDDITLVFISTPPYTHKELALKAIDCGKAVMLEKPIATTLADSEEVVYRAKKRNCFLQVGLELRYSKAYMKIKEWIDSGKIGLLKNISCFYVIGAIVRSQKNTWRYSWTGSGGRFQEKLCHYIDLPRWWADSRINDIYCKAADNVIPYYEVPDNVHCTYCFENGIVSHLTFISGAAANGADDLMHVDEMTDDGHLLIYILTGTRGAITANILKRDLRLLEHQGKNNVEKSNIEEFMSWSAREDHFYFHNSTDQNLDVIRRVSQGFAPGIDPIDSLETMRVCFEMEAASTEKKLVKR